MHNISYWRATVLTHKQSSKIHQLFLDCLQLVYFRLVNKYADQPILQQPGTLNQITGLRLSTLCAFMSSVRNAENLCKRTSFLV